MELQANMIKDTSEDQNLEERKITQTDNSMINPLYQSFATKEVYESPSKQNDHSIQQSNR